MHLLLQIREEALVLHISCRPLAERLLQVAVGLTPGGRAVQGRKPGDSFRKESPHTLTAGERIRLVKDRVLQRGKIGGEEAHALVLRHLALYSAEGVLDEP